MLIPVFASYQTNEQDYQEALQIPLDGGTDLFTGTMIVKIKPSLFLYRGSHLRLLLSGIPTGSGSIQGLYIGKSSTTGNSYNFAATPTQILVNGAGNFVIPPSGVLTDEVAFDTEDAVAYTIACGVVSSKVSRMKDPITSYKVSTRPPGYKSGDIIRYLKKTTIEPGSTSKSSGYTAVVDEAFVVGSILVA